MTEGRIFESSCIIEKISHCKFKHVPVATGVGGVKYVVSYFFFFLRDMVAADESVI